MPSYAVTLLSGGLDSTTVAAYAKDRVDVMSALTFRYGQSHAKEVDCAARVARIMGIEHQVIDISFLSDVAWYSALTSPDRFPTPSGRPGEQIGYGVPITYVPLRNTIFVSLAAAYLESLVLHAIEVEGVSPSGVTASVYMAPNALDYSGYPDCRPEFYDSARQTLQLGSKLWTEYRIPIAIETPIIDLSKAEIAALGLRNWARRWSTLGVATRAASCRAAGATAAYCGPRGSRKRGWRIRCWCGWVGKFLPP